MATVARQPELITTANLTEFFKSSVNDAASNQRVEISPDTAFYIVKLLVSYTRSSKLFKANPNGPATPVTLADLYLKAMNSETDSSHRHRKLRELGDLALFLSGVFADYLSRRGINIEYCVNMGGGAYSHLATTGRADRRTASLTHIFDELGQKFERFVDVVAEASSHSIDRNNQDLLALYENWLARGNPRDAVRLRRLGIQLSMPDCGVTH